MKKNHRRLISTLMIALMLGSQLTTAAWAENMATVDVAGGGGNHRKEAGYATPDDAEQKEEKPAQDDENPEEDDENREFEKTVMQWEFVDDENLSGGELTLIGVNPENRADFETVVSMLPTKVKAEIDGEETASVDHVSDSGLDGRGRDSGESHTVSLSVKSWNCPEYRQDEDGLWPFTGEYEFTAELPEGYVCEPPPSVRVILGGAEVYMINDLFTVDGLSYRELGPDTVKLVGYDGEKRTGSLSIPESVTRPSNGREYRVVRIGSEAFRGCDGLTGDLIIPDTVTEIGMRAFAGCKFTGRLTLSESLVRIEDSAFSEIKFTDELRLPDALEYIGDGAFDSTGFTGELNLPKKLNYIGALAFARCDFTGDLTIPDGVTSLGTYAFYLTKFTGGKLILSKGLNTISNSAFYGCGFTDELVLPEGVTEIGPNAFDSCRGFRGRLKIPNGIIKIEKNAFLYTGFVGFDTDNQEVADLLYASGVDGSKIKVGGNSYTPQIAVEPFIIDKMHYRIIKDNEVELVEYDVSDPAENINIPAVVKYPNDDTGKTYSVTHIGKRAFYDKALTGTLNLPDSLTSIGENAFYFNYFTGSLTIPDRVSNIGKSAFLWSGFTGDLHIKGKLTEIKNSAFQLCGFTGTLSMADTVTAIDNYAFNGCNFTGSLDLPAGLRYIGRGAFLNCNRLTGTLNIPESVTEISPEAFIGCDSLTSAHLGSNLQKLGAQAFPKSLPLSTDSPRVQLMINTYLEQDVIADTSWNGKEDVPDGAIAAIKTDAAVAGDKRIGTEAVITVPDGKTLTVDGRLVVDGSLIVNGTLRVNGTLVINGSLSGSGTLIIGRNGKVEGDTAGLFVEYQADRDDIEAAKKIIESHVYTVEQEKAGNEEAVRNWLGETIAALPGFGDPDMTVGEVRITAFSAATEGTAGNPNGTAGSFTFALLLSKGNSESSAGGLGTITATPARRSSGGSGGSEVNTNILRGSWERTETGFWKFRQTNGTYASGRWGLVDNLWYYFDGEGRMLTGWQFINNQWYYLCKEADTKTKAGQKEGAMITGWYFDPAYQAWFYLNADGAMAVGLKEIDGKPYYFNPESDGTRGALKEKTDG